MEKKVYVKNVSSFTIELNLRQVRYVRDLEPGQKVGLAEDVFEEFSCDPGCKSLLRDGFLKVITEDEEVQQQIAEIAPSKTTEEVNVRDLLMNQSAQKLGIALKEASPALKEQIVEMAMSLSIADPARVNLIKHYCNVDILQALALQR